MSYQCLECGATYQDERTCQSVFDKFLNLEFSDPAYAEVHFLTVACFMIQHGRYSDQGLKWIEAKLRDVLVNQVSPQTIRLKSAHELAQSTRNWRATRALSDPPQKKVGWKVTIKDADDRFLDSWGYGESITKWGASTLHDMQENLSCSETPGG
jgi:hypothetical protein